MVVKTTVSTSTGQAVSTGNAITVTRMGLIIVQHAN